MKKNVLLVVNPISGDIDKTLHIEAIQEAAQIRNHRLITYKTTGKDDLAQIKSIFRRENPDRVIVAGGDGTVKLVAEALETDDIIIGILPTGSANGLSVDLNLPPDPENNLDILFSDKFVAIDMISINGKMSLHLSDLGLNAHLVKNYENGSTRGKLGYAMQIINTLTSKDEPFSAMINANGKTIECRAHMIVIANSQRYGTGVIINPDSKMDDGKFEIVILKNFDVMILGKFISGNIPTDTNDLEIISTDTAEIKTSVPAHFQIDGEYIGEESNLSIRILPHRMKIAVPDL